MFVLQGYHSLSAESFCYHRSIVCSIAASLLHNLVETQRRLTYYQQRRILRHNYKNVVFELEGNAEQVSNRIGCQRVQHNERLFCTIKTNIDLLGRPIIPSNSDTANS